MKIVLISILSIFTLGFANADLISSFMSLMDSVMAASDAKLISLDCADDLGSSGVLCKTTAEYIDADAGGGSSELCDEVSRYTGGTSFDVLCSTCSYAKDTKIYQKSCDVELSEKRSVPNNLLTALNEDIRLGYIAEFETPVFQTSYETNSGKIEIYKLTYTRPVYGDGSGQVNSEVDAEEVIGFETVCEYITFDPEFVDYKLTNTTCEKPLDEVIDENLIDEL